jgi:hypothetical protein
LDLNLINAGSIITNPSIKTSAMAQPTSIISQKETHEHASKHPQDQVGLRRRSASRPEGNLALNFIDAVSSMAPAMTPTNINHFQKITPYLLIGEGVKLVSYTSSNKASAAGTQTMVVTSQQNLFGRRTSKIVDSIICVASGKAQAR